MAYKLWYNKAIKKSPVWASNEPVCSACSCLCLEKHNFGYFLYYMVLTLIKSLFRYCKVSVEVASNCWVAAQKWWVIELLGKIFWQESLRRVDSILSIIFSFSVICILSPCAHAQEWHCCPQPHVGWLRPPQRSSNRPMPGWLLGTWGHPHTCLEHVRLFSPYSFCHLALCLALCFRVVSVSWSAGTSYCSALSSQSLWSSPEGFSTVVTFWDPVTQNVREDRTFNTKTIQS